MTTDDPANTPQPGQHVWIEAIARGPEGDLWLETVEDDHDTVIVRAASFRWRPTDDPPQSLGHGTIADAFAGLEAMSEALRSPASPPQATQDDPQPPDAADQPTGPRDDPGASQGADPDVMAIQEWDAHERADLAEARAENARLRQQRDAARRELQQLRDEVEAIADDHAREAAAAQRLADADQGDGIKWRAYARTFGRTVDELRAALAGVTHNNQENQ